MFAGYSTELWFEPGVSEADALASQAKIYHDARQVGKLALILGAGNVSMLVPCDVTTKLFLENQVVLLKMNRVLTNRTVDRRSVSSVDRARNCGWCMAAHKKAPTYANMPVDVIHMTGSDKTFDAIVFGTGAEGEKNKTGAEAFAEETCHF